MDTATWIRALRDWDVPLLDDGSPPSHIEVLPWNELIHGLVHSKSPRLSICVIPLLLRHPTRASETADLALRLSPAEGRELKILHTAASACQSLYASRIRWAGLPTEKIEDRFSADLGLPSVRELHGRMCLAAMDDLPERYSRHEPYCRITELLLSLRAPSAAPR